MHDLSDSKYTFVSIWTGMSMKKKLLNPAITHLVHHEK